MFVAPPPAVDHFLPLLIDLWSSIFYLAAPCNPLQVCRLSLNMGSFLLIEGIVTIASCVWLNSIYAPYLLIRCVFIGISLGIPEPIKVRPLYAIELRF